MCTAAPGALTLSGMLSDPLIRAMMRSDGISEREHTALWLRVRDATAPHLHSEAAARKPEFA